jgi:hypothetical protein
MAYFAAMASVIPLGWQSQTGACSVEIASIPKQNARLMPQSP